MPRQPRLDIPHVLHHVIVRGIERRDIFIDDCDRERFVNRLSSLLTESATKCFAWSLMSNHFHLLLMPTSVPLSQTMRRLLTGYAVYFNRKHQRVGHLFQNRYKSILCEEEPYFLELIRYIHLNPLRAGLVSNLSSLDSYPWCGHGVLLGNQNFSGQITSEVLERFGLNRPLALHAYQQFIADGINDGKRADLMGGGLNRSQCGPGKVAGTEAFDERVLGSGEFVESVTRGSKCADKARLTLGELLHKVGDVTGVEVERMQSPGKERAVARAKAIFCYLAVRDYGFTGMDAGAVVCLGSSGVSIAIGRGLVLLKNDPNLRQDAWFSKLASNVP